VVLLLSPLALPDSEWALTLYGIDQVEAEVERARADGYYEHLVRAASSGGVAGIRSSPPPGWKPFAESGIVEVASDYRRWRLRPGLDARWNGNVFRTNRLGYRGPEIAQAKGAGTFRVAVLGSSNSLGHGVDDAVVYTRLLERLLDGRAGPGRRVEVVNLAVSGDAPTQRLRRLQVEVADLDPDWVLCDVTALDLSLEERHLRWVVGRGVEVPFDFVRKAIADSGVAPDDSSALFHRKFMRSLPALLERTYARWGAESRRLEVPLTVVILPRADDKIESPQLFAMFRDLARRHGLGCLDLSDRFAHLEIDEYRIAPWDRHPNALGHRVISEGLAEGLLGCEEFATRLAGYSAQQ
jgi:hypothetical protein